MSESIGLIGNGKQADEAASFSTKNVAFRAVSKQYIDSVARVDIENPSEEELQTPVCIAVGAPALKRDLSRLWPGVQYESILSKKAYVDNSSEIGDGSIVAPGSIITTNVKIGRHALINVAATIQHDTIVGDFSSIGPGAHIAGNVEIGNGVYVGIGANIVNDIRVADGVVIGAGATLISHATEENGVYVGVPAKLIKHNEDWLSEV